MREQSQIRGRIFRGAVLLLFVILCGNLFIMQVPRHRFYQNQALENRQISFRVAAPRGLIRDRDGAILADNKYIADITLPRRALGPDGPDSTLQRLLNWFDLPRSRTLERLRQQQESGRQRLILTANADMARIVTVEERQALLPGVQVEARARRRYLQGTLFAHVVGHVGEVSQADIDTAVAGQIYRLGDMRGKLGIEAAFESRLRGRHGIKLEEVDASGRIVGRQPMWVQKVEPGGDVTLTLSQALQESLYAMLGGRRGCGVALSLPEAEVLAACSSPSYDPNLLTASISTAEWEGLANDPAKPFFNRIIQATYPPGSLYKPITSLCALALGAADTAQYFEPCYGSYRFGNRVFRCWKRAGHGVLNHGQALVNSCDVFYYQLGLRLEIDQLHEAAAHFGLGSPCSNLFPEEASGHIPTAAWYDWRFGVKGWTRGVMLNNAIGQGEILVTPLQMAMLAARLATSGRVAAPRFMISPAAAGEMLPGLPYAEEHLRWVRSALEEVVDTGTGEAAQLAGIAVAGKTGTAQNPHGDDHAWFMCYAPAEDPRVALVVILENAGHGGAEAAPVAGRWLHAYFSWLARQSGLDATLSARWPGGR